MMIVRPSNERGLSTYPWLKSYHSFSFGEYFDRRFEGFRSLRVINEDWIAPGHGFGMHPHKNMEIVTYVLSGSLVHEDSMGNKGVITPGQVQKMSAGTGVKHSESNPSTSETVHLLQIWIMPSQMGIKPAYEQKAIGHFNESGLHAIAGPQKDPGIIYINQDAFILRGNYPKEGSGTYVLAPNAGAWIQVIRGQLSLFDVVLNAGDAGIIEEENNINYKASSGTEFLLFDLN